MAFNETWWNLCCNKKIHLTDFIVLRIVVTFKWNDCTFTRLKYYIYYTIQKANSIFVHWAIELKINSQINTKSWTWSEYFKFQCHWTSFKILSTTNCTKISTHRKTSHVYFPIVSNFFTTQKTGWNLNTNWSNKCWNFLRKCPP